MLISAMREKAVWFRWHFIPLRYSGKAMRWANPRNHFLGATEAPKSRAQFDLLSDQGYFRDDFSVSSELYQRIKAAAEQRLFSRQNANSLGSAGFVGLLDEQDFCNPINPFFEYALDRASIDAALLYFNGRPQLWNIGLAYSRPTSGEKDKESQFWHFDYGDTRILHSVLYLNEVTLDQGPFTMINRKDSSHIRRGIFVRRLNDEQMALEAGQPKVISVTGPAGTRLVVDPTACCHQGSRVRSGYRLALFATYASTTPCVGRNKYLKKHRRVICDQMIKWRPDLSQSLLEGLFL